MTEGQILKLTATLIISLCFAMYNSELWAEESVFRSESLTDTQPALESSEKQGKNLAATRIALVDLDSILRKSGAARRVRQLLDEKRMAFQEEFKLREAELIINERNLLAAKNTISDLEFNKRLKSFEEEVSSLQQQIQYRHQALDQAFQEAQKNIRALAMEIVKIIASERKLDFVLTNDSTLIFLPKYDISEDVLNRLNERTKNARIEIKAAKAE